MHNHDRTTNPRIPDEEDPITSECEDCGDVLPPEDLNDGKCPECYASSLDAPEGCDADER